MCKACETMKNLLFADDTNICFVENDMEELLKKINKEMNKLMVTSCHYI